jgi:hypothetical protein
MVRKIALLTVVFGVSFSELYAQDSSSNGSLTISGSVDAYIRYNFQNAKSISKSNNYTSFTNSQNSFELGMASVKFDYTKGKVGAVADLGFGTRAAEFSYNETGVLAAIKQAYITYAPSEKVKFTMGKWATHVGYELLDPQLNRNYSMSYMFSYGPFSHTGIKADFTLGDGFGAMVGVVNPTDYLSAPFSKKFVIGQVSKTSDNFSAFLNYVGGKDIDDNGINQLGLTALTTVSDKFGIGFDGTVKSVKEVGKTATSWWGSALYFNVDPSEKFGFTVRGEYFEDKKGVAGFGTSIIDATVSLNWKPAKGILIIPEFRLDNSSNALFFKNSDPITGATAKGSGAFILAAVFSF